MPSSPPSIPVHLRVPPDLLDRYDAVARRRARRQPGYSRSDAIREAMVAQVEAAERQAET